MEEEAGKTKLYVDNGGGDPGRGSNLREVSPDSKEGKQALKDLGETPIAASSSRVEETQAQQAKTFDNSRVYDLTKVSGDSGYVPGPLAKGSPAEARALKDLGVVLRPDLKAAPSQSKINH